MARGKPVCWCVPVAVKYGEETRATLTDKNVFDLASAVESALRETAAATEAKRIEEWRRKTWRIRLNLRVPGAAPFEVPYAIFDEDPVPGFKAAAQKWQTKDRKGVRLDNEAVSGEERQAAMASIWDRVFRKIPGDRLYQLKSSRSATIASNGPAGKKWVVTKVVQVQGKPVCWRVPVEVKTGEEARVTLLADNVFDLASVLDSTLRESGLTK
jgi:hypothetical protein